MGELIIDPVRKTVAERVFSREARKTKIVTAELGNQAGIYGAAAFTFQQANRRTE
jgi:predicted NBD/HSP70 family sugar kinase